LVDALWTLDVAWTPFLNARFVAFALCAALPVLVTRVLRRDDESNLAALIQLSAALLLLWGLTQESYAACRFYRPELGAHWDRWCSFRGFTDAPGRATACRGRFSRDQATAGRSPAAFALLGRFH